MVNLSLANSRIMTVIITVSQISQI